MQGSMQIVPIWNPLLLASERCEKSDSPDTNPNPTEDEEDDEATSFDDDPMPWTSEEPFEYSFIFLLVKGLLWSFLFALVYISSIVYSRLLLTATDSTAQRE
jgi:hypothetical protein